MLGTTVGELVGGKGGRLVGVSVAPGEVGKLLGDKVGLADGARVGDPVGAIVG